MIQGSLSLLVFYFCNYFLIPLSNHCSNSWKLQTPILKDLHMHIDTDTQATYYSISLTYRYNQQCLQRHMKADLTGMLIDWVMKDESETEKCHVGLCANHNS